MLTRSSDGVELYYEVTGDAETAVVFVAGWLGNARWWDAQRDELAASHRVVALDLAGHGKSGRDRETWTAQAYADDIAAVVRAVAAPRVILVGHSMSGAFSVLAAPQLAGLAGIILVDTLKNLEGMPPMEQVEAMFAKYREDFAGTVRTIRAPLLYGAKTPPELRERLDREAIAAATGDEAVRLIEPFYQLDVRDAAKAVRVPVRGIDTDLHPHAPEINRKYFADYDHVTIPGYGHYPMIEAPREFNAALRAQLLALA